MNRSQMIEITRENYSNYLSLNIIAFSHSFAGACGEGGALIMVTAEGSAYHTNFIQEGFTMKEIKKLCPPLTDCTFGLADEGGVPKGWQYIDLGMGNHLVIQTKYWHAFAKRGNKSVEADSLYQDWLPIMKKIATQPTIRITIHRGANQVGGCITEVATAQARIMIDLGSNLPGSMKTELTNEEVAEMTKGVDAVFYTHYHGDHIGLFAAVPDAIPQYIGEGALEVLKCRNKVLNKKRELSQEQKVLNRMSTYTSNHTIRIGDINITPYYCSHSAFDAYMFKIDSQGKVILHTGDFRQHGYLGKALNGVLKKHIGPVDILITEGTMLSRPQETVLTENDIKRNTVDVLKKHKYVYALCSSTDMERLASFHAACKETGRLFVCDEYQKSILDIFSNHAQNKDLFGFDQAFTYPHKESDKVTGHLKYHGFLHIIRGSQEWVVKKRIKTYNDEPSYLIYSMWQGYYNGDETVRLSNVINIRSIFDDKIFDGIKDGFHTSGHAELQTLRDVCTIIQPQTGIIFIHKDAASSPQALQLPASLHIIDNNEEINNFSIQIDN